MKCFLINRLRRKFSRAPPTPSLWPKATPPCRINPPTSPPALLRTRTPARGRGCCPPSMISQTLSSERRVTLCSHQSRQTNPLRRDTASLCDCMNAFHKALLRLLKDGCKRMHWPYQQSFVAVWLKCTRLTRFPLSAHLHPHVSFSRHDHFHIFRENNKSRWVY